VVVARLEQDGPELLVVTPVTASRVRAVAGGQEVASAPVVREAVLLY
jgi:hypothetical protein